MAEKTPITPTLIQEMRLLKWIYHNEYYQKNELQSERFQPDHNPRAYWYIDTHWTLNITGTASSGNEYYLDLSEPIGDSGYFCWLTAGRWGISFLHLRHVRYFEDLQELCWAIARMRLFVNEAAMKEYAKDRDPMELRREQTGE